MAPIAQSTSRDGQYDGSGPRFASRRAWLEKFGEAEYAAYVKDRHKEDGSPQLNYEEWKASSHVLGPYLWHATMDVWDEDTTSGESSNDDEAPNLLSPPQQMPVRPKKPTTNGHGMRPSVKSNASTPRQLLVEPSESAKRKRKPKKQYLSQEIIASDDSDEVGDSASIIEAPAPPTPTITSNGTRRKPGARRKKQFLSEETISPEDEIEDPISIDPIVKFPAKAANSAASESTAPLSKNKAPKPKTTRKYRKKYLSQETVPLDDDEDSAPAGIATPKNGSVTSPDGPGSMSASRRGLRTRTAAQQNPYQHNEKLFEDLIAVETLQQRETGIDGDEPLSEGAYAALEREETEVEDETPIGEEDVPSEETHLRRSGKAHYKGKGRAWKKTETDDDEDFKTVVKPKKAKLLAQHNLGRRKSTAKVYATKEEDRMVRNAALEAATKAEKASKSPKVAKVPKAKRTSTEPKTKRAFSESVAGDEKKKRRPRKPKISAEFVQDDSDTDFEAGEAQEQEQEQEQHPSGDVQDSPVIGSSPHKTVNTKVNTRKSDQAVSTTNEDTDLDDEADFGAGQKRTLGNEVGSVLG